MRIEIVINKEKKIAQPVLEALESEIYKNLLPLYPKTAVRIRKGTADGIDISGLKCDGEKRNVMDILQQVWEDDGWLN
ncbi:DinI-like family protein [Rosenbergiella epipactidis]|uniref:DinI-like family protein n=1 Tax=Rosenbergiella epipactidis TaxID=1544694 RepID=UPI001F4D947E|nr:DinI-like family protein [Rosenbergiella epipactidis]